MHTTHPLSVACHAALAMRSQVDSLSPVGCTCTLRVLLLRPCHPALLLVPLWPNMHASPCSATSIVGLRLEGVVAHIIYEACKQSEMKLSFTEVAAANGLHGACDDRLAHIWCTEGGRD